MGHEQEDLERGLTHRYKIQTKGRGGFPKMLNIAFGNGILRINDDTYWLAWLTAALETEGTLMKGRSPLSLLGPSIGKTDTRQAFLTITSEDGAVALFFEVIASGFTGKGNTTKARQMTYEMNVEAAKARQAKIGPQS